MKLQSKLNSPLGPRVFEFSNEYVDRLQERGSEVNANGIDRLQEHSSKVNEEDVDRLQERCSKVNEEYVDRLQEHCSEVKNQKINRKKEHCSNSITPFVHRTRKHCSTATIRNMMLIKVLYIVIATAAYCSVRSLYTVYPRADTSNINTVDYNFTTSYQLSRSDRLYEYGTQCCTQHDKVTETYFERDQQFRYQQSRAQCKQIPLLHQREHIVRDGYFISQTYVDVITISVYSQQHLMSKHDFVEYRRKKLHFTHNKFCDIFFTPRYQIRTRNSRTHLCDTNIKPFVGGGKEVRRKNHGSCVDRGSKVFEGSFLSEFECFTSRGGVLSPMLDKDDLIENTYELKFLAPINHQHSGINDTDILCNIPITRMLNKLTKQMLSTFHELCSDIDVSRMSRISIISHLERKITSATDQEYISVFKAYRRTRIVFPKKIKTLKIIREDDVLSRSQSQTPEPVASVDEGTDISFPPHPITDKDHHRIISNYCTALDPSNFHESGCAVCGRLTPLNMSSSIDNFDLGYLSTYADKVTRKQRRSINDPIEGISGPVADFSCRIVCAECSECVKKKKLPKISLANGLWIGEIPKILKELTFAEKLLIARVRTNRYAIKVQSGMHKTKCNIVAFENPVPQIYEALPPPASDIEEVFAVLFFRSTPPSEKESKEIPLYNVRRRKVQEALEWLKLNHVEYQKINISQDNLKQYPENGSPVSVMMYNAGDVLTNKDAESTAVNDTEKEEGVEDGSFAPICHGLIDKDSPVNSWNKIASDALTNLKNGERLLVVGHTDATQSLFKNPSLYSSAFPWLFPYGLGSIDNVNKEIKLSSLLHKRFLLMYHDKRFQLDSLFSIFAFNHEQIKDSTTAGFIQTKHSNFQEVCDRINNLDHKVLNDINDRYSKGEIVKPITDAEQSCFRLINDLDNIAEKVQGSLTSKKRMRNEIWSLVNFKGAPSWFVTFAPADNHHPLCLYFADTEERFVPKIRSSSERYRLIAQNPVAGARFFHFMVEMFITHVLGVDSVDTGAFGRPSAYYGTVEQQGRLTLHLHLLLWIKNSLSPQEIRNRIMDPTSDFQKRMIDYLESAHQAEYVDSTEDIVRGELDDKEEQTSYVKPSETLPLPPPRYCDCKVDGCMHCIKYREWKTYYKSTVNDIIFRSNRHTCSKTNCMQNKYNTCKARFPRQVIESSMIDPTTGAICVKHKEAMLNTFNHLMSYLQRCNSDSTSLLSGTAIKSTIAYVTDYITKCSLNTHVIFQSVASIFERFPDFKTGTGDVVNKSRQLLTKLCNSLVSKLEIGAPMACMYLLGNPDHYTSHTFVNFYWRSFVNECLRTSTDDEQAKSLVPELNVTITKGMRASSPVYDYMYRPNKYSHMCLYDWVQQFQKIKGGTQKHGIGSKKRKNHVDTEDDDEEEDPIEHMCTEDAGNKRKRAEMDSDCDVGYDDTLMFIEGHPQRQTHQPKLLSKDEYVNRVPNFVGGILPRRDSGDFEFYATVMLTLFKPWRSGSDLKKSSQSWSEEFNAHKFSAQYNTLMDHFNLRYECSDARDDFAAQRKLTQNQGSNAGYAPIDMDKFDSIDYENSLEDAAKQNGWTEADVNDEDEDPFSVMGVKAQNQMVKMNAIESLLHQLGWTKCVPDVQKETVRNEEIDRSLDWSNVLKEKRAEVIASRADTLESPSSTDLPPKVEISTNALKYIRAYLNKVLVRWKDITYLFKNYHEQEADLIELKQNISTSFDLNDEQQRAFNIITNHLSSNTTERLQMYLGGMAGTGKSQVIKAVTKFFNDIGQPGKMVLLAPTGSAAALIGGSTYHSYLGITTKGSLNQTSRSKICQKLEKVKYIFIDEVSMLSCLELYKISAQLAIMCKEHELPFGGMNMIFAGDFAQLPPPGKGCSLYSRLALSNSITGQKNAIGKALWHQTTTVVILRKNMRQRSQTIEDSKLRNALENMRYKACTTEDIEYLHDLSSTESVRTKMQDQRFRNVSVITAQNCHRDRINELGTKRFASDTNQKLISFYSKDTWTGGERSTSSKKQKLTDDSSRKLKDNLQKQIPISLQRTLWNIPPKMSEHKSGILNLCKGLPLLIKYNEATECCVTNGAEAKVVDWISYLNPDNNARTLKTLFVELQNPPTPIQLPNLPLNVVPISADSKNIECEVPDGSIIKINRTQIPVIPNFAMTDYCSQGRTRPFNVVHLNNCTTHQSYYTCLSRSATHDGTFILNGINSLTITKDGGPLPGHIRQEFRELELLDEISKLRYECRLPSSVSGNLRRDIINQYRDWVGDKHVPKNVHESLRWDDKSPFQLAECEDLKWKLVSKDNKSTRKTAALPIGHKNTRTFVEVRPTGSRITYNYTNTSKMLDDNTHQYIAANNRFNMTPHVSNTVRLTNTILSSQHGVQRNTEPSGTRWDSINYSCSYDSMFSIIWNIWQENNEIIEAHRQIMNNRYFDVLVQGFARYVSGHHTLEDARNGVRELLTQYNANLFPVGCVGVDIKDLLHTMLRQNTEQPLGLETTFCSNCGLQNPMIQPITSSMYVLAADTWRITDMYDLPNMHSRGSTEHCALLYFKGIKVHNPCTECRHNLQTQMHFNVVPKIFAIHISNYTIQISHSIIVDVMNSQRTYKLKGLIYYADQHFTSQFVDKNNDVWYHDGIQTGHRCIKQGNLSNLSNHSLLNAHGHRLCSVIYSLQ